MRRAASLPDAAWLVVLLAVYAVVLLVAAVGASYWPAPPRVIALLNELAILLFGPAPILLALALLLRARLAIVLAALPVALFVTLYGARFVPVSTASARPHQQEIVVYTANIAHRREGFGPLLDQIEREQPDVVLVQELIEGADELDAGLTAMMEKRPRGPTGAPGPATGEREPLDIPRHRALAPRRDYTGVGMWSRFPIVDVAVFPPAYRGANLSQRVRIDVEGTIVTVYNVHLNAPVNARWEPSPNPLDLLAIYQRGTRSERVGAILADAQAQPGPVLLAGDFNLTDRTYDYRRLADQLTDVFAATGWGLGATFPAPESTRRLVGLVSPLIRIDYVWAGRDVSPRAARVVEAAGSDHLGLVARLAL